MKTIGELYNVIADMPHTSIVFAPLFTKEEADEFIEEHFDEQNHALSNEEWLDIVARLDRDGDIWQELMSAWGYAIEKVIIQRQKEKGKNDSQ